jgi:uncharacterized phage protein gp47/JayE
MNNQPKFADGGAFTSDLYRATTRGVITLTGSVPANTVEMQIRINQGPWLADTDRMIFTPTMFTVPNPAVFPEGLFLSFIDDITTLEVRAINALGHVSPPAIATIQRIPVSDLQRGISAPTGISITRRLEGVDIRWGINPEASVIGYHVYASLVPDGVTGYVRINRDMITVPFELRQDIAPLGQQITTYTTGRGELRQILTEQDVDGSLLQVITDQIMDVNDLLLDGQIRVTTMIDRVQGQPHFRFRHDRSLGENQGTLNRDVFGGVPFDQPLYYVMTAIALDPVTGEEQESRFSEQLVGAPLAAGQVIPVQRKLRTRYDATTDYINSILRQNNQISTIPGSVVRDLFIDGFTSEVQRLHFVSDFLDRSLSFLTLLQVDDQDRDGVSDPVQQSPYKRALAQALGTSSDADLQAIIDDRFDKLASNVDVVRLGATSASGSVLFVTNTEPLTNVIFDQGVQVATVTNPAVVFQTTARVVLPAAQRASFFNAVERRWEIRAPIEALQQGAIGNVSANQIQVVNGGPPGFRAINPEPLAFGRDEESNTDLANRAILALSAVDAGTKAGYLSTALNTVGVSRASVIQSGDVLMQRDWDEVRQKHLGGKVDMYIRGQRTLEISQRFALGITLGQNIQFFLDSAPSDLIFVANDPRLTPATPIMDMLGKNALEQAQGFRFRNITTGQDFHLQGVTILSFNRIQLNAALPQPVFAVTDIMRGSYRFQSQSSLIFPRQPVQSVQSVQSVQTGVVLGEGVQFQLVRAEDPLLEGRSTLAQDRMDITPSGGIPSGQTFVVNDERHVLVGNEPASLTQLGVNPITLRVFNLTRTVEYTGPFTGAAIPDYFIEAGDAIRPLSLVRNVQGAIANGQEVSVDYTHDENFVVRYNVNAIVQDVQQKVEDRRHATADVIVKDAVALPIHIEATIVLRQGADRSETDAQVRTSLGAYFAQLRLGEAVYQSDVIRVIEQVGGVNYVVVPFARMTVGSDALIVRERKANTGFFLQQTGGVRTFVLSDPLRYATLDGGGRENNPRGVFKNTQPLRSVTGLLELYANAGTALILGNQSRVIPGYTDEATLIAAGFLTPALREARRFELTANRVMVSIPVAEALEASVYDVTYQSFNDRQVRDVMPNSISYAFLASLTLTYRT